MRGMPSALKGGASGRGGFERPVGYVLPPPESYSGSPANAHPIAHNATRVDNVVICVNFRRHSTEFAAAILLVLIWAIRFARSRFSRSKS